jgi:hypothetical protein
MGGKDLKLFPVVRIPKMRIYIMKKFRNKKIKNNILEKIANTSQKVLYMICSKGFFFPCNKVIFPFFFIVVLGGGYIMAFTKALTMYQIYHTYCFATT